MKQAIHDIVAWCDANGQDSVEMVRDYLAEKDTHITRAESERLVARARAREEMTK